VQPSAALPNQIVANATALQPAPVLTQARLRSDLTNYILFLCTARRALSQPSAVGASRRLKRLEVAEGDPENAAVGGLHHGGNAVTGPGDRHRDLAGVGAREFFEAAHDIDMRERPPAILAALDGGDVAAIEADQQA
jgi:hypothetical protein